MKKHIALAFGFIVFSTMFLTPFAGAFASSDPGISGQVFNSAFSWYTGFPLVDSNGYLDLNDWSISYRSNGVDSTAASGSGDVVYLYQNGDYIEYSFQHYDLLSSYLTPVWFLQFGQNPSYSSGGLSDLKYTLYQSYNSSESSYKYIRPFSYDNRMIDWTHVMFSYPGTGITKIRIEFDGTPAIWNCIYMKFLGYRISTDAITQADLYQLQAQITTSLNVARLADLIEIDSSDIDLSTLEATTASILQKLANVPDIIQYIDNIESIDSNILSAVNTLYNFMFTEYNDFYSLTTPTNNNNSVYFNGNQYLFNDSTPNLTGKEFYVNISSQGNIDSDLNNYIVFRLPFRDVYVDRLITVEFYRDSASTFRNDVVLYDVNCYYGYSYWLYVVIPSVYVPSGNWWHFHVKSNLDITCITSNASCGYYSNKNTKSQFYRIIEFLKLLVYGNQNSVPTEIQTTTDDINQNATTVNNFQSSTQQSLDQNLNDVPVVDYQIQATTGTQYMKAYSEALFNASNGFRIWYMLPLILFVIGMLIRWGVKK